jgi:hypothetical protein
VETHAYDQLYKKLAIDSLHAMFVQDNSQFYWPGTVTIKPTPSTAPFSMGLPYASKGLELCFWGKNN